MADASSTQLILSALGGGLLSAGLSFVVRIVAEDRAAKKQRKRSAEAAFIQLTDVVATSHIIREYTEAVAAVYADSGGDGTMSYKVAIYAAELMTANEGEMLEQITPLIRSYSASSTAMMERLSIGFTDLANLPSTTIFLYGQWASAAHRFHDALEQLLLIADAGKIEKMNGQFIHATYLTYTMYVKACRLLSASYSIAAELPDQYGIACLKRSYNEQKTQIAEIMQHHNGLTKAMTTLQKGDSSVPDTEKSLFPT